MNISDVIQRLQTIHGEHGDFEVFAFGRGHRLYEPVDEVYVSPYVSSDEGADKEVVVIS
jgi:hypothetical protein